MMRLRAVAEQTKIELSRRSRAVVRVDEIAYGAKGKPLDLVIEIRRDEFVSQVADIIDKTFPVCEESLKLAGLTIDHIDDVILVGGTTKIPYVRDQVSKFFAKAPRTDVNPEDAVAAGAALQATALERILKRKKPSRAPDAVPTPVGSFDLEEPSFDGASTQSFGGDSTTTAGNTDTFTQSGVTDTKEFHPDESGPVDVDQSGPIDVDQPLKRRTAAQASATKPHADALKPPPPPPSTLRATERPVTRGEHKDVFEERTPPPAPPSGPVLGRLTKSGIQPGGGAKKTSIGIPIQPPPPPPAGKPNTTAPRLTAQRPPAVPASSPMSRTMIAEPDPTRPATNDVSTVIVDPAASGEDIGFPNIPTEKGFLDLDDVNPASTARGFAPPPDPLAGFDLDLGPVRPPAQPAPHASAPTATPAAKTLIAQRADLEAPRRAPGPSQAPPPSAPSPRIPPGPSQSPLALPGWPAQPVQALANRSASPVVLDVTPRGLGIGTVAGFCEELIRRNSRVPTEMKRMFSTSRDNQDAVRIVVVQGESRRMDNNIVIADLRLDNLPRRPRGETSIEVTFMIDANGILQVSARDAQTGREQRASLDIVGSIAQEDVSSSREKLQALRR